MKIKIVTFKIIDAYDELIKALVEEGHYRSKSDFIRTAIMKLLKEHYKDVKSMKKALERGRV